ncbi:diaminopimelate decarboxylase [Streptomyces durbertensis]|uniref:Diaminopimelate decarboxylase n=1 Tax=Streptomyces durbertensis TaxID=2448886 RepID=A0ABR6ED07_9ACTN|nr:diaminopimelate decarboxylase [Streptomyces durbertensis]MBB1243219.1 diaminopimelate decarboxylase [Streptomyces durbertensis]
MPPSPAGRDHAATAPAHSLGRRRDLAVQAAVRQGLLDQRQPVVGLLDVAALRERAAALRAAFDDVTAPGTATLHAFAVKAASLVPVLRLLRDAGLGAEVASPGELALARAAGVPPERVVFDSPAKTTEELREALRLGIAVNADNPQELARLDALVPACDRPPPIGLRVNPQLGAGTIGAVSTATATSKFGVALRDAGAREEVRRAFLARPWLNRLHVHSGSQGVPAELMAEGVAAGHALAEEINSAAGRRQITGIDIGGGLPVDFTTDDPAEDFAAYAALLRRRVPGLFDGRYTLVTEFGRALAAKAGTVLARVEYTKSAGGRAIAVTHAGAQTAVRTVFAPDAWPLRVLTYDASGAPKNAARTGAGTVAASVVQDVAGPCCFAGDLVATGRELPALAPGDLVALPDTGAYYFSTPFGYNSLPRPGVYGFGVDRSGEVRFATVRRPQSLAEIVAEAGGAHEEALTALR